MLEFVQSGAINNRVPQFKFVGVAYFFSVVLVANDQFIRHENQSW